MFGHLLDYEGGTLVNPMKLKNKKMESGKEACLCSLLWSPCMEFKLPFSVVGLQSFLAK